MYTDISLDEVLLGLLLLSFPIHLLVNAIAVLALLAFLQKESVSVLLGAQPEDQDLRTYLGEFETTS